MLLKTINQITQVITQIKQIPTRNRAERPAIVEVVQTKQKWLGGDGATVARRRRSSSS